MGNIYYESTGLDFARLLWYFFYIFSSYPGAQAY